MWPYASQPTGRKRVEWERAEQETLFAQIQTRDWSEDWYHWPNERWSGVEAKRLSFAGVRPGPADNWLFRPSPCGRWTLCVSELKRPGAPPSSVSEAQRAFLDVLEACGACVGVHQSWQASLAFFDAYMAGKGEPSERWWER